MTGGWANIEGMGFQVFLGQRKKVFRPATLLHHPTTGIDPVVPFVPFEAYLLVGVDSHIGLKAF